MRIKFVSPEQVGGKVQKPFEFFLEFPCRLNKGDELGGLDYMINENDFTPKQLDTIYDYAHSVKFVSFFIDEQGIYQKVFLNDVE